MKKASEIAAILQVTKKTVLEWYHAGIIPAVVAVGRTYRFDMDEVSAALAEHSAKQAAKKKKTAR